MSDVGIGEDVKITEEDNASIYAFSGDILGESNGFDRWNPSNPVDEDSTGGEAYNGGGGEGDGSDDDPTGSKDEDGDTDDEDRIDLGRSCDPLLLSALETCGIEGIEVQFRLVKPFNSVSGIVKRATGDGKSLMSSLMTSTSGRLSITQLTLRHK